MTLDPENLFTIKAEGYWGGDKTEKHGWPRFGSKKFPNYEKFWQLFVVPKTNRPKDIHYNRDATTEEERAIGSIHYAIFQNFDYIYSSLRGKLSESSFELSFIKLSNNCDLVEELLFRALLYYKKVDIERIVADAKSKELDMGTDEVIKNDFLKRGSYSIVVMNRVGLVKQNFNLSSYLALSGKIRNYRNTIAHSWQSFRVNDQVPKVEYVQKYKDWIRVTDIVQSGDQKKIAEMVLGHYIARDVLIRDYTDQLISNINIIWEKLIKLVPSQDFEQLRDHHFRKALDDLTRGNTGSCADTIPFMPGATSSGTTSLNLSAGIKVHYEK